jgi:hypothetical protein
MHNQNSIPKEKIFETSGRHWILKKDSSLVSLEENSERTIKELKNQHIRKSKSIESTMTTSQTKISPRMNNEGPIINFIYSSEKNN